MPDSESVLSVEFSLGEEKMISYNEQIERLSIENVRDAAEKGDPEAQYQLGLLLSWEESGPEKYDEAAHWFQRAADQGSSLAMVQLGQIYEQDRGIGQDIAKATWFYLQAAYHRDNSDSLMLLRHAAENRGLPVAQYYLAYCLEREFLESESIEDEAAYWFRQSWLQGYLPAKKRLDQALIRIHQWDLLQSFAQGFADPISELRDFVRTFQISNSGEQAKEVSQAMQRIEQFVRTFRIDVPPKGSTKRKKREEKLVSETERLLGEMEKINHLLQRIDNMDSCKK